MHRIERHDELALESLHPVGVRLDLWVNDRRTPSASARVDRRPRGLGDLIEVSYNWSSLGDVGQGLAGDFVAGMAALVAEVQRVVSELSPSA